MEWFSGVLANYLPRKYYLPYHFHSQSHQYCQNLSCKHKISKIKIILYITTVTPQSLSKTWFTVRSELLIRLSQFVFICSLQKKSIHVWVGSKYLRIVCKHCKLINLVFHISTWRHLTCDNSISINQEPVQKTQDIYHFLDIYILLSGFKGSVFCIHKRTYVSVCFSILIWAKEISSTNAITVTIWNSTWIDNNQVMLFECSLIRFDESKQKL